MDFSRRDISRLVAAGAGATLAGAAFAQGGAAKAGASASNVELFWAPLDHIVWAVPDLKQGIETITRLTGLTPASGGNASGRDHPHNAVISLGGGHYLEIISPTAAGMKDGPWLDAIKDGKPHVVAFGRRVTDRFAALREKLKVAGYKFEGPRAMDRTTPDGNTLRWELLFVNGTPYDPALPFFIDWLGSTPHPSVSAPQGSRIESFFVAHPDAEKLAATYASIGVDVPVVQSDRHSISVVLSTPKGRVYLR